jgi:DNA-binding transcriptional LysR family regulator
MADQMEQGFGPLSCRLQASNVHDALLAFVEGGCDLLMCYHHPKQPVDFSDPRYSGLRLGVETLRPYVRSNPDHAPRYALPGTAAQPLPFLGYASNAYFRLMTDLILAPAPTFLSLRYETDMAEGLKNMVLEGHGVAFLPTSSVQNESVPGNWYWQQRKAGAWIWKYGCIATTSAAARSWMHSGITWQPAYNRCRPPA